MKSPKIN